MEPFDSGWCSLKGPPLKFKFTKESPQPSHDITRNSVEENKMRGKQTQELKGARENFNEKEEGETGVTKDSDANLGQESCVARV